MTYTAPPYFPIISPWRKVWPFIWTNLNTLHTRMLCTKFGSNWTSGSGEEVEMWNVYRQTDGRTDVLLSFQLRWAKNFVDVVQFNSVKILFEINGFDFYSTG